MCKIKFVSLLLLALSAMAFVSKNDRPVHVFMAGDSTMADKVLYKTVADSVTGEVLSVEFPERGWGMLLPEFFTDEVVVKNYAKNGRSTRTFIEEGLWDTIMSGLQRGDYVVVQFGHNDASEKKVERYTPPADYKRNLARFIDESREKGGIPILCTPVARRKYDNGKIVNTHGVYTDLVKEVAQEKDVPLVDMFSYTEKWLNEVGEERSARFFMNIPAGANRIYPNGLVDNTHFVEEGARTVAGFFVSDMKAKKLKGLTKYLKKK